MEILGVDPAHMWSFEMLFFPPSKWLSQAAKRRVEQFGAGCALGILCGGVCLDGDIMGRVAFS